MLTLFEFGICIFLIILAIPFMIIGTVKTHKLKPNELGIRPEVQKPLKYISITMFTVVVAFLIYAFVTRIYLQE